jgi:hypothetical protein
VPRTRRAAGPVHTSLPTRVRSKQGEGRSPVASRGLLPHERSRWRGARGENQCFAVGVPAPPGMVMVALPEILRNAQKVQSEATAKGRAGRLGKEGAARRAV